ncbi:MAG: ATP-binding protein [Planctomycetota bacterium]|nr:ATP-binding protein [Planctomycetota bacterium]
MSDDQSPLTIKNRLQPHWPVLGIVFGIVSGIFDFWFFRFLNIEMNFAGGQDAVPLVVLFFSVNICILGYTIGRLALAKVGLRENAETITKQMLALEESRTRVLESEKLAAIGRLAAGIAHEVRNPLGVIRASATMLAEEKDTESDGARARSFIVEEVDRLNSFVTGLLSYARPAQLILTDAKLSEIAEAALGLAKKEYEEDSVTFSIELATKALAIQGDSGLLTQVVLSLMSNGAEATGKSGALKIRCFEEDGFAVLDVLDDGPGVEAEAFEQIFDPFFTTKSTGTGLGLATAARIIEGHKGTIEALSKNGLGPDGRGACFRLRFQLLKE